MYRYVFIFMYLYTDTVKTNLTLNDVPLQCPATVAQGSVIKFQCQNSPSPCDATITIDNNVEVMGENNVTYTINGGLASNSQHNFTFSYSVCRVNLKSFVCIVKMETYGQSVYLHPVKPVTTCSNGLRAGFDFYIVSGTVNATIKKLSNFIDVLIQRTSSNHYQILCTGALLSCVSPSFQGCYCATQQNEIYEIIVNRSISLIDSEALFRAQWNNNLGTSVVSNEQLLPRAYDADAVKTHLTLNTNPMQCPETVTRGSVIKFQCQNSPSPCVVTITADNNDEVMGKNTVTYFVNGGLTSNSQHNFTFSYSVCGVNLKSFVCLVTIESEVTSIPSAPSGTSVKTSNRGSVIVNFILVFSFNYILSIFIIPIMVQP